MGLLSGFAESFLNEWCRRGRLLWDNAMLAEDVVPASFKLSSYQLEERVPLITILYPH